MASAHTIPQYDSLYDTMILTIWIPQDEAYWWHPKIQIDRGMCLSHNYCTTLQSQRIPENTKRFSNVGFLLVQPCRCWTNIKSILGQCHRMLQPLLSNLRSHNTPLKSRTYYLLVLIIIYIKELTTSLRYYCMHRDTTSALPLHAGITSSWSSTPPQHQANVGLTFSVYWDGAGSICLLLK